MFSPSGRFADAHTLSLPFTIATRRNQDYQVQRMMSSYTATCFWLYGNNVQDGLLLQWVEETAMGWERFKLLFMQYFRVNAEVDRGLQNSDFDLLQYKIQCNDCSPPSNIQGIEEERKITFKNILCPHLRYECGSTNVRFSVWRGLLELLQLFQDNKTCVKKLWEKNLLMGFMEFDQVAKLLSPYPSALIMRLSFVTGGTICITLKSTVHQHSSGIDSTINDEQNSSTSYVEPMHLEPLDLKKLQAKSLVEYLRDIALTEKIKYLINANGEPIQIGELLLEQFNEKSAGGVGELETSRCISSNVTHSGDVGAMQQITFTAMRIAVVTCKVKPPSADMDFDEVVQPKGTSPVPSSSSYSPFNPYFFGCGNSGNNNTNQTNYRLPAAQCANDDFVREVIQLCNFWGKSKQDLTVLLEQAAEEQFATLSLNSGHSSRAQSIYRDPSITTGNGRRISTGSGALEQSTTPTLLIQQQQPNNNSFDLFPPTNSTQFQQQNNFLNQQKQQILKSEQRMLQQQQQNNGHSSF